MHEHVALLFPGRRYGPEMPLLRYPALGLAQLGADVHVVDYPQVLVETASPTEDEWAQAMEFVDRAVAARIEGAARVTLVAKSLGTRVVARLARGGLPAQTAAAWLTPIFVDPPTVAAAAAATSWRSLYAYGSADPSCDASVLRDIVASTRGTVVRIDGGDHGLEVDGDVEATLRALLQVTSAVLTLARVDLSVDP